MENKETNKKPIKGYEGLYSILDDGRVISEQRLITRLSGKKLLTREVEERILKPGIAKCGGYHVVVLNKNGTKQQHYVHRLVAEAFLPPPLEGQTQVRHKEGIPTLNGKDDLEWGTPTENSHDRVKHGTDNNGEKNGQAKLTADLVLKMRAEVEGGRERCYVAAEYDVPISTFNMIIRRKLWKHI